MRTITYTNKSALYENAGIDNVNKCNAADMNEIKEVVNANATEAANNFARLNGAYYSDVDLNNFTTTGVYYVAQNLTHAPAGNMSWLYLFVANSGGNDLVQYAISVSYGRMFIRTRSTYATNWKAWQEVSLTTILSGTSLPSSADNGTVFLLYDN